MDNVLSDRITVDYIMFTKQKMNPLIVPLIVQHVTVLHDPSQ